jgi:hypothetical protein
MMRPRIHGDILAEGRAVSLSAWEQQALDSIKNGITESDPELAALLSAFTRLAAGEKTPDREPIPARSRRRLRRLRRGRRCGSLRMACQRLGFLRAALLLSWVLTTAALIATAVAFSAGDHSKTCTDPAVFVCAVPASGHAPGSPAPSTTASQAPQPSVVGILPAGP